MEFSKLAAGCASKGRFSPVDHHTHRTLYQPMPCGPYLDKGHINIVAHVSTNTVPVLIAFTIIATPR